MADELNIETLPEGNDDISKLKRLREILKNKFLSVNVEEGLTNLESVQKLLDDLDKAEIIAYKLESKYEDSDEETYELITNLGGDFTAMWNCLSDIVGAFEKSQHLKINLKLQ